MKKKKILTATLCCALALCVGGFASCGTNPSSQSESLASSSSEAGNSSSSSDAGSSSSSSSSSAREEIKVSFDKQSVSLQTGDVVTLTATVENSTANPTFQSSDDSVASVSPDGRKVTVTALKAGTATIKAVVEGAEAECEITVTKRVEDSVSLDKEYIVMEDGGETLNSLELTAEYTFADEATGTVTFSSSDPEVVSVSSEETGKATLTALKTGTVTVTAAVGSQTASCTVEVASYGLTYEAIDEFSLRVTGGTVSGDVRIPAYYWSETEEDYLPVEQIGDSSGEKVAVFSGNNDITSIYLGDNMITVNYQSFQSCGGLKSVYVGKNVSILGDSAFNSCKALKNVVWGEECSVSSIGNRCFWEAGLISVSIPESVTSFGTDVFRLCGNLLSCRIYAPLTKIPGSTFLKCDKLVEVYLPATLTKIEDWAFGGYSGFPSDGPRPNLAVYFAGSEEEWNAVNISDSNNGVLTGNDQLRVSYNVQPSDLPPQPSAGIVLDKQTASMRAGGVLTLTATVTNTDEPFSVHSSDETVAIVSKEGNEITVTALKVGTVTITAEVEGKSANCVITVEEAIEDSIRIDGAKEVVVTDAGEAYTLHVYYRSFSGTAPECSVEETGLFNVGALTTVATDSEGVVHATISVSRIEGVYGRTEFSVRLGDKTATVTVEVASAGCDLVPTGTVGEVYFAGVNENFRGGALHIPARYIDAEGNVCSVGRLGNGNEAVYNHSGKEITDVYTGEGVLWIMNKAFQGMPIDSVHLGSYVLKIWDSAFQDSTLAQIEYNAAERLTEIAFGAFWGTKLTQAVIPASVTTLGTDVFRCCAELTSCKIYASLTVIPGNTFLKCDKLIEVYLPATLTKIEEMAFGGYNGFPDDGPRPNLAVNFAGSEEQWNAVNISDSNNGVLTSNDQLTVRYGVVY